MFLEMGLLLKKRFVEIKWGKVFSEQDWADAACIALWGLVKFGKTRV